MFLAITYQRDCFCIGWNKTCHPILFRGGRQSASHITIVVDSVYFWILKRLADPYIHCTAKRKMLALEMENVGTSTFSRHMNILNNLNRAASDLSPCFPDTPWAQRLMPSKVPPPVSKKRSATHQEAPKIRKLCLDVKSPETIPEVEKE